MCKRKFKINKITAIIISLVIIMVVLGIYNQQKNINFWDMSFYNIMTAFIAVVFAFIFNQIKNDERRLKDFTEKLIINIKEIIIDQRFKSIKNPADIAYILVQITVLSNKVDCLEKTMHPLYIEDEVMYIKNALNEYETLIGDHVNDVSYLSKSCKELGNKINLIDSKCDYIILKLYGC